MSGVEEMTDAQAFLRLCAGLRRTDVEVHKTFLASLVKRAGRHPLLLKLANGRMWALGHVERVTVTEFEDEFSLDGLTEFDRTNHRPVDLSSANAREVAFTESICASVALLTQAQKKRFLELAIFPPNTVVPYETVALYWGKTAAMGMRDAWDLLNRLSRMGLVENIEPTAIRLHDKVRSFARDPMQMSPHTLISLNGYFLKAYVEADNLTVAKGTAVAQYAVTWLPWHAAEAGE
jgi:hypothetical protein